MSRNRKYIDLKTEDGRNLFYNSAEWQATRRIILIRDIYCQECLKEGIYTIATECDHIVDLKHSPERCLDTTNLQGLCKSHHSKKTFIENRGTTSFGKKNTYTVVNKRWDISLN